MNEEFVQTKADYGSRQIEILGPDDVKFVISPAPNRYWTNLQGPLLPATDHLLWRIHNSALRSLAEICLQLFMVESYDDSKAAFRAPIDASYKWPPIQGIQAGAWTDFITFLSAEGSHVRLGDHDAAPSLPWLNGDESATRRWRLTLRVIGLSKDWLIKLDLRWETWAQTFEIRDFSAAGLEEVVGENTRTEENEDLRSEKLDDTNRTSSAEQARMDLDSLAVRLLASLRECFRAYRIEIGAQEWSSFYVGENSRYVGCFAALIEALVSAHLEYGYSEDRLCPAVFACIAKVVAEPAFDTSRGPDYYALPLMPATYPWRPAELFENGEFQNSLKAAISSALAGRLAAGAGTHSEEKPQRPLGRKTKFTAPALEQARKVKSEGKLNQEIARVRYGVPTTPAGASGKDLDFTSKAGRISAIIDHVDFWAERMGPCSEASIARSATVHPSDLSRWKKAGLPGSQKANRIEDVLKNRKVPVLPLRAESRGE